MRSGKSVWSAGDSRSVRESSRERSVPHPVTSSERANSTIPSTSKNSRPSIYDIPLQRSFPNKNPRQPSMDRSNSRGRSLSRGRRPRTPTDPTPYKTFQGKNIYGGARTKVRYQRPSAPPRTRKQWEDLIVIEEQHDADSGIYLSNCLLCQKSGHRSTNCQQYATLEERTMRFRELAVCERCGHPFNVPQNSRFKECDSLHPKPDKDKKCPRRCYGAYCQGGRACGDALPVPVLPSLSPSLSEEVLENSSDWFSVLY